MSADADKVQDLLRQQKAIAQFGSFALRHSSLHEVLEEAVRVCAEGLGVPFAKICRYRAAEKDLVVETGFGWDAGVIGTVVPANDSSPQGRAFFTGLPSICRDLRRDTEFELPAFYKAHGIISTIYVLIKGNGKPYGVLEIDNDQQHDYDEHDINFLTSFANVLAEAVATSVRVALLQSAIEDKDRLLEQKKILAEELQHRVRNNLQLVNSMLNQYLGDTADEKGRKAIRAIARRVASVAEVYDHLLGSEMTRTTDFGGYVKSLCRTLADTQAVSRITLTCESEEVRLSLDIVTALGIVIAELVTNSFDHAFPNGEGAIKVTVRGSANGDDTARVTVSDDGLGFTPQAESKRRGLGLAHRLVDQVHGTLTHRSDDGTAWEITFPVARETVAA